MKIQQLKTIQHIVHLNPAGQLVADSIDIANLFGKQHKNVLRDIQKLIKSEMIDRLNFEPISYLDSMNREQKKYELQEHSCLALTMGFTGDLAMRLRIHVAGQFIRLRDAAELTALRQEVMLHRELQQVKTKLKIKNSPITEAERVEIRRLFAEELCKAEIARRTGRSRDTVRRILRSDVPNVH